MDGRLLKAAVTGDASRMRQLASDDPAVLLGTTPQANTCLHIASIYGHEEFCRDAVELNGSLLDIANRDGETPLLAAVTRGHPTLASVLLGYCLRQHRREAILKQDRQKCNALHHAVRRAYRMLALELIEAEKALSEAVNERNESPMLIAVMRGFADVFDRLLGIPDSAHSGPLGFNVLHAAVRCGNLDMAQMVLETRPELVREENENNDTPVHVAVNEGMVDVLAIFLEHDPSLGYLIHSEYGPILCIAALQGHVNVAQELLKHCPDAPYCDANGSTCLHVAVSYGEVKFVEFVQGSQELQNLINMTDNSGKTALHLAATAGKTDMVDVFLLQKDIDITVLDNAADHAKDLIGVQDTASTSASAAPMDGRLLSAAVTGDAALMRQLANTNPAVLLETTPQRNTCLHIASIHGHEEFCRDAVALNGSLLDAVNEDGETALLIAVTRGHAILASILLASCRDQQRSETILKQDVRGCNALHHAISRGERTLALELIEAEPGLSKAVNKCTQSPMFIAVTCNYTDVLDRLLEIPDSSHSGDKGLNVLHAAVTRGNIAIARRIMETRSELVRQENRNKHTPIQLAVNLGKVDVLTILLEHDPSLGYFINRDGTPLLCIAASKGHVRVARELLKHCPDAPYGNANGSTCLHVAASSCQEGFVKFILESQQLQHHIYVADNSRKTALDVAISARDDEENKIFKDQYTYIVADLEHHLNLGLRRCCLEMDQRLLKAATCGYAADMRDLTHNVPGVLLGTTPQGNSCLHIASIHGHERFCEEVQNLEPSLLSAINSDDETPLVTAVVSGHDPIASILLRRCLDRQLSETILKQDKCGCNALHHAIRSGHTELALKLIEAAPALSHAVNEHNESPMFIAVMRNYADVFERLLEVPDSAHVGVFGYNALHAAVRNGNSAIARRIMETRPGLAREEDGRKNTPMQLAVHWNKIEVLRVLLEHDRSLGYVVNTMGTPLIYTAAYRGNVDIARELFKHCPDAPYGMSHGLWTCLQEAVSKEQTEFVKFVQDSPQLHRLVNMRDYNGETPLHLGVRKCNPKLVAALLRHQHTDVTVLNNDGIPANWMSSDLIKHAKTLNWNEVSMLMLKADPQDSSSIHNLHMQVKNNVTYSLREDIKSLTQTYIGNTSIVAILITTITFAAAFTLPGGYSAEAGNEGLPVMGRKIAFQAFLISDTLAMCSSLVVAFVCIIARWEDLEFLLYYRSFTKQLMWFAYVATTTAFATGLYTVLAPRLLWLAVTVCVLTSLMPILTLLLGQWPILKLKFRFGWTFKSELLGMV